MCGIAGLYAYGAGAPPVDAARLQRMREAMAARGPDGAGAWVNGSGRVGLAHRRLAIIDLSETGAQPMLSADGGLAITFNGEIYNYRELRAELAQAGAKFVSTSDTEVLLHLYQRHGPDMVRRLRGMYAFAIWDEKRQGVFAARDPFGIKPLYLADDGATVAFASQVKALLAGGGIDTRPEAAGHTGFFVFGYVPEPFTLYRGIRALPSGTSIWIDRAGRHETLVHFDMTAEIRAAEESARAGARRADDDLRAALSDSVAHHLIADVPVGVFLSAGLDSATVTALAAELQRDSLRTVTLAFAEYRNRPEDEAPLAEAIARHYGAAHQTRVLGADEFAAELDAIVAAMDQPSIDGVNTYFVSKVTAATGLKVALSGLGGDELFAGYSTFAEVPRLVRALGPFRRARALGRALRALTHPVVRRIASPKYAGVLEYGADYPGAYLLRRALRMPWELRQVFDPAFARQGLESLDLEARLAQTVAGIESPILKVTALEAQWYMRNQLLRDSDWAGMAHSLEIRTPLVDLALFRAVLPLLASAAPPGKQAMARTPRKPLPAEVLGRAKTGFLVPVREWAARGSPEAAAARGYRGWADIVYRRFTGAASGSVLAGP
jgi:asparagine synthase (glutamine-hydrolysing)